MIYCDASLVVTALVPEARTAEARRWFSDHGGEVLAASWWVETEVASALAQKQRQQLLTEPQRRTAFAQWRLLCSSWEMLEIEGDHFVAAGNLTDDGLRAGDALHLAVAVERQAALATRDHDLARVAREKGLVVHAVE